MTDFITTPDENFENLADFKFRPNYHRWQDMRVHYIDEGPKDGPVMLLLHGMPTWSYIYRDFIDPLTRSGYRCIAPDHLGFGRSDKPIDIHWYTIARHTEVLTTLITSLGLENISLVCQDWGGPIGLAQAATMPDRFDRLIIMNTWLHHKGYEYCENVRSWIAAWEDGGFFFHEKPNVALIPLLDAGLLTRKQLFETIVHGVELNLSDDAKQMYDGYFAPLKGLSDQAYNGYRRFPLSIPMTNYHNGNAAAQEMHYRNLLSWDKNIDFIWGIEDEIFTESWGQEWAKRMKAPFKTIQGAKHFLQNTHAKEIVDRILD